MKIIAAYSENHTKPINTLCGQNADLLNVTASGTYISPVLKTLKHLITETDGTRNGSDKEN
jgi:hypothetical protein